MIDAFLHYIAWGLVIILAGITVLLALNKQSGLALIQHRPEMLPQAMLVRYAGMTVLALITAWIGAPRVLFGVLLAVSVIGFGDAFIYRRADHPFWLHLIVGGAALFCAFLSLIAMN